MNDTSFGNLYKTWPTDQLLDIVDNPDDYQQAAVIAARLEISSRQLTAAQLTTAKNIQAARQQEELDKKENAQIIEEKLKSVASSVTDTFKPIHNQEPGTDRYILLISIFIGGLFVYEVYSQFAFLSFMFSDMKSWDFASMLYFLPLLLLPLSALLFWFRIKTGWLLATLYFSYSATGNIPLLLSAFERQPTSSNLDIIFPAISPVVYAGSLLLFSSATWIMCKKSIREVYGISRQTMITTVGLGIVIVFIMAMTLL